MFTLRKLAVVLSTALAANAQLSGLSSTCTGSAGSLLLGPLGSCLSLTSLIPIFSESGSIIAPLDSYLGQICSSSACSSDTISSANQTIQQNCASDIQSGSGIAPALATILDAYPTVREVACLQAAGNGTRCITQTLYAVQNATGQDITIDYLTSLLGSNATSELSALGNLDASVLCTDCTRAMYLVAEQNSQSTFTSGAVGKAISSKCGSSFASTSSFPADVSNTIGSATASASGSSTSAAASSTGAAMKNIQAASVLSGSWALIAGVVGMGVVAGGMGVLA